MSLVNYYIVYQILKRLTTDFKNWKAFKLGVIDEKGKVLIPYRDRNLEQRQSLSTLDVLIMNLKKILGRLPGGSSKFATYTAALFLLKEDNITEENFHKFLKEVDHNHVNMLIAEEHGAGFFGTTELTNTYKKDTPGQ